MTSTPQVTPHTAPRTAEELHKLGIFQLRMLVTALHGLDTEEQQMAFASMTAPQKAELALNLLRRWDTENPGAVQAAQAAPPPQQAPMPTMAPPPMGVLPGQQPLPMGPRPNGVNGTVNGVGVSHAPIMNTPGAVAMAPAGMVAQPMGAMQPIQSPMQMPVSAPPVQVDPAALARSQAAAAPAATPATSGRGRSPRNGAAAAASSESSELSAEVMKMLSVISQSQQTNTDAITSAVKELTNAVDQMAKQSSKEQLDQLAQSYSAVYQVLSSFDQRLNAIQGATQLSITLSLFLAEQVLGAPRQDILKMAVADIPQVQSMLGNQPGKA